MEAEGFHSLRRSPLRSSLSGLLDRAFPVPEGRSFFDDFPVWDERVVPSGSALARFGAFEGEKLVACAGVRLARLAPPHAPVSVALIGAVATDADSRGRGLATRLVGRACDWARERGAQAVFLWGSEHSLYRRLGFELAGAQSLVPLGRLEIGPPLPAAPGRGWSPGIFDRMLDRPGGLALAPEDRRWIGEHRNVEWFWTGASESPAAYAAVGRGIDLRGLVHEWGGEPAALRGLLAWLARERPDLSLLTAPWLPDLFGISCGADLAREYLCLARVFEAGRIDFGSLWFWGLDAV